MRVGYTEDAVLLESGSPPKLAGSTPVTSLQNERQLHVRKGPANLHELAN